MRKLRKYGIILTTIITIFTSSLIVAKAAGTSATIHTLYKDNTLGTAYEYAVISVEFADYTTGTIIISVSNLAFYDYMVFGARLSNIYSSGNTRRLTLQVDDCKQVIIYCLPHEGSKISISPSIYSNDTNYVEHINQNFIESQFATTNGYIDNLESTCNSIYTDVHNIYLQLVDQALDLDNIQTALTNISGYIQTTNTNLSNVYTQLTFVNQYLGYINTSASNIDQDMDDVLTTLENINGLIGGTLGTNTKLDAIIAELGVLVYQGTEEGQPTLYDILSDVFGILTNMWNNEKDYTQNLEDIQTILETDSTTITNILTTIQNIDNTIDTITWENGYFTNWGISTTLNGDYTASSNTTNTSQDIYFRTQIPDNLITNPNIAKVEIGLYNTTGWDISSNTIEIFYVINGNKIQVENYYIQRNAKTYTFYIYGTYASTFSTGTRYLYIHMTTPYYARYNIENGMTFKYIYSTDIEYWQLLNYFTTYEQNKKIINLLTENLVDYTDKLDEISGKLDGIQGDTTTNQDITEFNTNMDIITEIETDFNTDFGDFNTDLDRTIFDIPSTLLPNVQDMHTAFTQFYNIDLFKYPVLITILGAIVLILLG